MKKNLCRKGICGWLSLSMVLTGMSGSALALHAEEVQAEETASVTADIYPKPQNETYLSDEGMNLSGEVNIVVHGDQEEATIPKLQEMLADNGYTYVQGDYDASKSNIIISSSREHCDECMKTESEALDHTEGYVLSSSDDENVNGDVTIVGSDADGAILRNHDASADAGAEEQRRKDRGSDDRGLSGDRVPRLYRRLLRVSVDS